MNPGIGRRELRIGLVLALGALLVVLDTTVTMVAVPAVAGDLGASLPTIQWITTGYLLGVVAVIPVAGWACNRYGQRRVYLTALVTFTLASALVAVAWSTATVIAFRVLQGLGGGLLNPVGMAIGLHAVSRQARGRMMSLLGLPVVIGPVLGPPLAGALIDASSWRAIFVINVPLALVTLGLCRRVLPRTPRSDTEPTPVDWYGLTQLSGGAVLLVLGCARLGDTGRPTPVVLAAVPIGAGLLAVFVRRAVRSRTPLVRLRLLARRPMAVGTVILACFGAAYFGSMTILPIYVQAVRGDSALLAGMITIPMGIAVGATLQVATRLVDRLPALRIVVAGTSLGMLGCLLLWQATTGQASYAVIAAAAAVLGIGSGATLMPTMTVALRDLDGTDTPSGTTLLTLLQQLAAALGTAAVATVMTILIGLGAPGPAGGGIDAMLGLPAEQRVTLGGDLAAAVGDAYLVGAALCALSVLAAVLGLRRRRRRAPRTPAERASEVAITSPKNR
jgi:EmrB/QacA subfamily drug resistance transporter